MPLTAPTWITAVATVILGAGAIVTAIFAILAFRKQSLEVRLLQQGAADQQALIEQQAEAIRLQANQIDLQGSSSATSRTSAASRPASSSSRPQSCRHPSRSGNATPKSAAVPRRLRCSSRRRSGPKPGTPI
jgi:hypothetical protein